MKNISSLYSSFYALILFFCVSATLHAQPIATANCSSVSITGGLPAYANNLYFGQDGGSCQNFTISKTDFCTLIASKCNPEVAQFLLQKKNGSTFQNITGWQTNSTFSGVAHGTYRVLIKVPVLLLNTSCPPESVRKVFNSDGKEIGFVGKWSTTIFSNEVVVGATVASDLAFSFLETQGNTSNSVYCSTETPKINTTGSINYTQYVVNIQEVGGLNRYNSLGFQFGAIPGDLINLLTTWQSNHPTWQFVPGVTYSVLFSIITPCNSAWVSSTKTFTMVAPGLACRVTSEVSPISIFPNPANNSFSIANLDSNQDNYKVTLFDLAGRVVKQFEPFNNQEYDISEVNDGFYFVSVAKEGVLIYTQKLSVVKF